MVGIYGLEYQIVMKNIMKLEMERNGTLVMDTIRVSYSYT